MRVKFKTMTETENKKEHGSVLFSTRVCLTLKIFDF